MQGERNDRLAIIRAINILIVWVVSDLYAFGNAAFVDSNLGFILIDLTQL